jgi:surface polysaccharide O-acyltransferase-like enzyme
MKCYQHEKSKDQRGEKTSEDEVVKQLKEIDKKLDSLTDHKELFWLFWGIALAFGFQVVYDEAGEYPEYPHKFYFGLGLEILFLIVLILWVFKIRKRDAETHQTDKKRPFKP